MKIFVVDLFVWLNLLLIGFCWDIISFLKLVCNINIDNKNFKIR